MAGDYDEVNNQTKLRIDAIEGEKIVTSDQLLKQEPTDLCYSD